MKALVLGTAAMLGLPSLLLLLYLLNVRPAVWGAGGQAVMCTGRRIASSGVPCTTTCASALPCRCQWLGLCGGCRACSQMRADLRDLLVVGPNNTVVRPPVLHALIMRSSPTGSACSQWTCSVSPLWTAPQPRQ